MKHLLILKIVSEALFKKYFRLSESSLRLYKKPPVTHKIDTKAAYFTFISADFYRIQ